jgi:predicted metal-dependent peptidase
MSNILDLLALARWQASKAVPYLARGLWACTYILDEGVETFAIDRQWRVLCNPSFAEQCAKDGSLPGLLVHEALHQVLRHGQRGAVLIYGMSHDLGYDESDDHGKLDRQRWNCAGDCEINARLDEIPAIPVPACGVRAATFGWPKGLGAEEYYRQPDNRRSKPRPQCSGGSGAGNPHPAEAKLPKPGDAPEQGPQGLSEAEGELVRAGVAGAVKDAAARKPGTVPAGILRWAESYGDAAPVDWRSLAFARIRYATEQRKGPSPSYARPSRRQMGGLVLPVYRQPSPRISLVLDTSGSMRERDLGTALGVVIDACMVLGHVSAVACDAQAGESVDVRHVDDLRDYLRGGGGTDMIVGIARAEETNPDAIVVVTDGETPWPPAAPGCPLVVVLTRAPSYCAKPPAWAEVIQAY